MSDVRKGTPCYADAAQRSVTHTQTRSPRRVWAKWCFSSLPPSAVEGFWNCWGDRKALTSKCVWALVCLHRIVVAGIRETAEGYVLVVFVTPTQCSFADLVLMLLYISHPPYLTHSHALLSVCLQLERLSSFILCWCSSAYSIKLQKQAYPSVLSSLLHPLINLLTS